MIKRGCVLDVATITDLDIAKQVAKLALAENERLHKRLLELVEELASLKGDQAPEQLELEIARLKEQMAGLQRRLFAASSERRPRTAEESEDAASRVMDNTPRRQRKLDVETVEHRLDESEMDCSCCGKPMVEWTGQTEETEEVDVVERRFVLKKHVRAKYRCKCGGAPRVAPGPLRMPGGGRYSLDFAIEVVDGKWHQHLPLERQTRVMRTEGLDVTASTLWEQAERLARVLAPNYEALRERVANAPLIHADETPWPMLRRPKRRHWAWCLGTYDALYFHIDPSRSHKVLLELLEGFQGVIVADGYTAYPAAAKLIHDEVTVAVCWSHARRKFVEAEPHNAVATEAIDMMGELFLIERELPSWWVIDDAHLRARALAQIRQTREEQSRPRVEALAKWASEQRALPKSKMGEALAYLDAYWDGLCRFLDDPLVPMTNNFAERSLRGAVVGRKNFYGCKSVRGTEVAALFYSLIETAKLCGVQPKAYLREAAHRAIREGTVLLPHEMRGEQQAAAS